MAMGIAGNLSVHGIEHAMAIVILGSLLTSTVLNLFVVHSLYLRWGKEKSWSDLSGNALQSA